MEIRPVSREETEQLLKNLHLRRMAEMLPEALLRANKESPSYNDFLLDLLRAQYHLPSPSRAPVGLRSAAIDRRYVQISALRRER